MSNQGPRPVVVACAVTMYAVVSAGTAVWLLVAGAGPVVVTAVGLLAAAGLVFGLTRHLRRRDDALARMAEDVEVMVSANPSHRLASDGSDPPGALAALTTAVNRLAEERESARRHAETTAEDLRREVESERNRLADLMARLGAAVVVCNADGRVLLYNETARALVADPTLLGLGRTVFGLVDRGLVAHARQRLGTGESAYTATTLYRGRMLRVHVAPVQDTSAVPGNGLVLVLEDQTQELRATDEQQRAVRALTEGTRASLGSIRAAVEALLEFPGLGEPERQRFLEVVRDESDRLGRQLDEAALDARPLAGRGLDDISAADLLAVLGGRLRRAGVECREESSPGATQVWLRADGHALAAVLTFVAHRLGGADLDDVDLVVSSASAHVRLDLRWTGGPPSAAELAGWLDEPLGDEGATTGRQVLERHSGEVWAGREGPGAAQLSLLLPRASENGESTQPSRPPVPPVSRPEFYDFDLLAPGTQPGAQWSRTLDTLTFTVLDTETTGLDPAQGDRIVSVGAVRVVNGRVLRQETFEQLVNPGRTVPSTATAIHGLTDAMLADAPPLEDVLPQLARFAEDTVLVGHNIGFDLRFLRSTAQPSPVDLTHPALDTLLLDAALYPAQPDHTLEAIAARFGISVVGRHTALGDALVTAEVLVRLLGPLSEAGIRTLDDALAASRRALQVRAGDRPAPDPA